MTDRGYPPVAKCDTVHRNQSGTGTAHKSFKSEIR